VSHDGPARIRVPGDCTAQHVDETEGHESNSHEREPDGTDGLVEPTNTRLCALREYDRHMATWPTAVNGEGDRPRPIGRDVDPGLRLARPVGVEYSDHALDLRVRSGRRRSASDSLNTGKQVSAVQSLALEAALP
jgi:hypothetical protein